MPTLVDDGAVVVMPFGIEVDHPRNCDLLLQAIPGCRLRTAIRANRTVRDSKTGQTMTPRDQSIGLATFPDTPGMQLHVNTRTGEYVITDPLSTDTELCEKIDRRLREAAVVRGVAKIKGVPNQSGKLDQHRLKTLCRELRQLLDIGHVKAVKGVVPELEDIDAMPGKYLLNPGSQVANMQPQFEDDWDAWVSRLAAGGG